MRVRSYTAWAMLLYFLLALIVIMLWQIHADIQRANKRLFNREMGADFLKSGKSNVSLVLMWLSRGTVAAVIIALVGCAFYINR